MRHVRIPLPAAAPLAAMVLIACSRTEPQTESATQCDDGAVRDVVERAGAQLRSVSLLAPDTIVRRDIGRAYEALVTRDLLRAWLDQPATAPGRQVSSPWPARMEISSIAPAHDGCRVEAEIVHVTSADTVAGVARDAVTLTVVAEADWRIAAWDVAADATSAASDADTSDSAATPQPGDDDATGDDSAAAAAVIRRYYAAIDDHDFPAAYALWRDAGAASGQTLQQFADGFAATSRASVAIGEPGRIEGAAGSRYIEIPVIVNAVSGEGTTQRFTGVYVLRRSVVTGATPSQREWRISAARLREAE